MLLELTLSLMGHCGDIIVPEYVRAGPYHRKMAKGFKLAEGLDWITPAERAMINEIAQLGFVYARLEHFVFCFAACGPNGTGLQLTHEHLFGNPQRQLSVKAPKVKKTLRQHVLNQDLAGDGDVDQIEPIYTIVNSDELMTRSMSRPPTQSGDEESNHHHKLYTGRRGLYISALSKAIDECLESHRRLVVQIESMVLREGQGEVGISEVEEDVTSRLVPPLIASLMKIRSMLAPSYELLPGLLQLVDEMRPPYIRLVQEIARDLARRIDGNDTTIADVSSRISMELAKLGLSTTTLDLLIHHTSTVRGGQVLGVGPHGVRLLDNVARAVQREARPLLSRAFLKLQTTLERLLALQCLAWTLRGTLNDPYDEFVIQANAPSSTRQGQADDISENYVNQSKFSLRAYQVQVCSFPEGWAEKLLNVGTRAVALRHLGWDRSENDIALDAARSDQSGAQGRIQTEFDAIMSHFSTILQALSTLSLGSFPIHASNDIQDGVSSRISQSTSLFSDDSKALITSLNVGETDATTLSRLTAIYEADEKLRQSLMAANPETTHQLVSITAQTKSWLVVPSLRSGATHHIDYTELIEDNSSTAAVEIVPAQLLSALSPLHVYVDQLPEVLRPLAVGQESTNVVSPHTVFARCFIQALDELESKLDRLVWDAIAKTAVSPEPVISESKAQITDETQSNISKSEENESDDEQDHVLEERPEPPTSKRDVVHVLTLPLSQASALLVEDDTKAAARAAIASVFLAIRKSYLMQQGDLWSAFIQNSAISFLAPLPRALKAANAAIESALTQSAWSTAVSSVSQSLFDREVDLHMLRFRLGTSGFWAGPRFHTRNHFTLPMALGLGKALKSLTQPSIDVLRMWSSGMTGILELGGSASLVAPEPLTNREVEVDPKQGWVSIRLASTSAETGKLLAVAPRRLGYGFWSQFAFSAPYLPKYPVESGFLSFPRSTLSFTITGSAHAQRRNGWRQLISPSTRTGVDSQPSPVLAYESGTFTIEVSQLGVSDNENTPCTELNVFYFPVLSAAAQIQAKLVEEAKGSDASLVTSLQPEYQPLCLASLVCGGGKASIRKWNHFSHQHQAGSDKSRFVVQSIQESSIISRLQTLFSATPVISALHVQVEIGTAGEAKISIGLTDDALDAESLQIWNASELLQGSDKPRGLMNLVSVIIPSFDVGLGVECGYVYLSLNSAIHEGSELTPLGWNGSSDAPAACNLAPVAVHNWRCHELETSSLQPRSSSAVLATDGTQIVSAGLPQVELSFSEVNFAYRHLSISPPFHATAFAAPGALHTWLLSSQSQLRYAAIWRFLFHVTRVSYIMQDELISSSFIRVCCF